MKIGIYGGTFNPPHMGHVHAAAEASRVLGLDKLLVIPDNIPPHKDLPADTPTAAQRLAMAHLAFDGIPNAEISDMELCRTGKSYSVDTVREVHARYPDAELWLLMGSDMLEIFHLWHEPEEIARLAKIGTFVRGDAGEQEMFDRMLPLLSHNFGAEIRFIPMEAFKVSSTEIRASIAGGTAEELLPQAVLGYILREHLYGTKIDLTDLSPDALRPIALSYLKPRRMPHVLGTEETAVHLAQRYGADVRKARIAALLHDCTKKLSVQEHMEICRQYGVVLDEMEQREEKLLHAKTGAEIAKHVFGVSDDIYEAIKWHTTGKPDMSLLEKVIYIADYMEPTRHFPGVEKLRETVFEDLDAGVAMGLQNTIDLMERNHEEVHRNTLDALCFLKG